MHTLILPMYYPEKESPSHRGYMFKEQAMELAKAGDKVGLLFVEQRPPRAFTISKFFKESHYQTSEDSEDGFVTMRLHAWNSKLSTHIGAMLWVLLSLLLIRKYVKRHGRPDIIHAHFSLYAGYVAYFAKKIYGIAYVVTEHASSIGNKSVSEQQQKIIRKIYASAGLVIAVGEKLKESIIELRLTDKEEKITVIHNLIDTHAFKKKTRQTVKKEQFRFVSVANLVEGKGFVELVKGFDLAFKDKDNVSLTIVGDGEQRKQIERAIGESSCSNRVQLMGRLNREDIVEQLSLYDAFVLVSRQETFGMVYVEALSAGLPVLATDCGVPKKVMGKGCGVMIANDGEPKTISEGLLHIYNNYESYYTEAICRYARQNFDLSNTATLLNKAYKTALGQ